MSIPILVTGFQPFGDDEINSSLEAVKLLPNTIGNYQINKLELPVVYYKSWEILKEAIEKYRPKVVILVGLAGGRPSISIERVAININDTNFADNEGQAPKDELIDESGPDSYFTTLPYRKIVEDMIKSGIPAYISDDAGTFICNHVMYHLLNYNKINNLSIIGGFIHVPFCTEQVLNKPRSASLTLEQISKGLQSAINSITIE